MTVYRITSPDPERTRRVVLRDLSQYSTWVSITVDGDDLLVDGDAPPSVPASFTVTEE